MPWGDVTIAPPRFTYNDCGDGTGYLAGEHGILGPIANDDAHRWGVWREIGFQTVAMPAAPLSRRKPWWRRLFA